VEARRSVLFASATLFAALSKAKTDGQPSDHLMFYRKPKLLIIDELGHLPFERPARISFAARSLTVRARPSPDHDQSAVAQWGAVLGDDVCRRDPRSPAASQ
jgi:hypothetical protein